MKSQTIVLEFLKNLQGFSQDLVEKVPTSAIFIAGHEKWDNWFSKEELYHRSFDEIRKIDIPNEMEIMEILNNRILYCAADKNMCPQFSYNAITTINDVFQYITPFQYIVKAEEVLKNTKDELHIIESYHVNNEITDKVLLDISNTIKANSYFTKSFNTIIQENKEKEIILKDTCRLISIVYDNRYIPMKYDNHPNENELETNFSQIVRILEYHKIIEKSKTPKVASEIEIQKGQKMHFQTWILKQQINEMFDDIYHKYRIIYISVYQIQ